jgi:hypothetical protein
MTQNAENASPGENVTMAVFNYETTPPSGNSNNTNQTIVGTSEDDVIIAGPASPLHFGSNGRAVPDNDDVTGGGGNDLMTGGYGSDTFRFNFTEKEIVEEGTFTIGSSFELNGITYNLPSTNASANAWATWDAAVDSYVQSVVAANGWEIESLGEATTTNTNPGRNQPSVTTTYTTSISWSKTVIELQGEGDDVITDFSDADRLIFSGVPADWETYLSSSETEAGTLIDYAGGSLLLQGVSTDITGLLNSGGLTFA